MFALIITLVSIALVALLAVVSMWYGGDAFTKNTVRSSAATVMSGGNQISGAVEAYKAQFGGPPSVVTDLVSANLLQNIPMGNWVFANDYIVQGTVTDKVCAEANKQLNFTGIPACSDPSVTGVTACCSTP